MTIKQIIEKLEVMIKPKRFHHSLAVKQTAFELAKHYGADEEKAALAGLIHDCAKGMSNEDMLKLADESGILIDNIQRVEVGLLHAPVGVELAKREFGILDPEVLKAVRFHTTGCQSMDLLTKILYIADYTADDRNFPGVEDLRRVVYANLDAALLMGMDLTIKHVISKNGLIHPDTVNARNYLILSSPGLDYRNL